MTAPSPKEASGHRLTRLSATGARGFERRDVALPCRVSFTMGGMRGVQSVFALTRNLSRSGVLLVVQRPMTGVRYVALELSPGTAPSPAVVRRTRDLELGCEFLEPLSAKRFTELVAISAQP